jgi:hypothetical protein
LALHIRKSRSTRRTRGIAGCRLAGNGESVENKRSTSFGRGLRA